MKDRVFTSALMLVVAALAGALIVSDVPLDACAGNAAPIEIVEAWPQDQYLLVVFGGGADSVAAAGKAIAGLGKKINLKVVDATVKAGGGTGSSIISPRGKVLARFSGVPKTAEIAALVRSPGRVAIVKGLTTRDAVVVVYSGSKSPNGKENLTRARNEVKTATNLFDPVATIVTIDAGDPAEAALLRNMGVEPGPKAEGFVVVFANGRMLPPVVGKTKKNAVLDRLQYLFTVILSCFPHQFDEDLLLER